MVGQAPTHRCSVFFWELVEQARRCQAQALPRALPLPLTQHTSDTVFRKGAGLIPGKHHQSHPFGLQHLPFLQHHAGMYELSQRRQEMAKGEVRAAFTVESEEEAFLMDRCSFIS